MLTMKQTTALPVFLLLLLAIGEVGCAAKSDRRIFYVENGVTHIDRNYLENFDQLDMKDFSRGALKCANKEIDGKVFLEKIYPEVEAHLQHVDGASTLDYMVPVPTYIKQKRINGRIYLKIVYSTPKDPGATLIEGGVEAVVDLCSGEVLFSVNFSPF